MNKKKNWLVIPTLLLPYLVLFALATIFFSTRCTFFAFIMGSVFHDNAINLIAALLLFCLIAAVLCVIYFARSIRKGWDALSLAKSAMILKLLQVPAYVLIFVLGVLFIITIFTFPFSVALFLLDCFVLFLTSFLTVAAVINAVRQGVFEKKEVIWIMILQLVFCADVVASVVFYLKLKKRY